MSNHGGKREGAGRKPGLNSKKSNLTIRLTPDVLSKLDNLANCEGMTRSEYLRLLVRQAIG